MKKNRISMLAWAAVIFFIALFQSCRGKELAIIKIADNRAVSSSLIYIALENHYFEKEGVQLSMTDFLVGKNGLESVLKGLNDVSVSAQSPLIFNAFNRADFKIIAAIASGSDNFQIVARKDKKILSINDLIGKKINAVKGTALEYFLILALEKNGVDSKKVKITNFDLNQSAEMIQKGELDAVVAYNPISAKILKNLGDDGIEFSEPGLYTSYSILTVNENYEKNKQENIEKLLRALKNASIYYSRNREKCLEFLSKKYFNTDVNTIKEQLDSIDLNLFLNQNLVSAMEREASWIISSGLTTNKTIPDFMPVIQEYDLEAVVSNQVQLIR